MPTKRTNPESPQTGKTRILRLAQSQGVLRARDLASAGVSRSVLQVLQQEGKIIQRSRGLYVPTNSAINEHETLIEASARRMEWYAYYQPYDFMISLRRTLMKSGLQSDTKLARLRHQSYH